MLHSPETRQIVNTGTDHPAIMTSIKFPVWVMTDVWRPREYVLCLQEEL